MKTFQFDSRWMDNEEGCVAVGHYGDGSIAIRLISAEDGSPLSVPTVCLTDYGEKPDEGNVFVKDYSESEGVYDTLRANGVVGSKIRTVYFGMGDAKAYECEFLLKEEEYQSL